MTVTTNRPYALIAILVVCLIMSATAFWYAGFAAQRSTRNFCSLMGTLDRSYEAAPPSTPTGQLVASEVHNLYQVLGCSPSQER